MLCSRCARQVLACAGLRAVLRMLVLIVAFCRRRSRLLLLLLLLLLLMMMMAVVATRPTLREGVGASFDMCTHRKVRLLQLQLVPGTVTF